MTCVSLLAAQIVFCVPAQNGRYRLPNYFLNHVLFHHLFYNQMVFLENRARSFSFCLQLFRRFAAHLDTQAKKAPKLAESSAVRSEHPGFGVSIESAAFLSRFRFLEVVGAGSYSTVHRAIEKATGRPVAIKVIKKEILSSQVEAQIRNEAVRPYQFG